jgi:anthranilate/para-aminobenzoate synthase component II
MAPTIIILDDESSVAFNVAHSVAALGWSPLVSPLSEMDVSRLATLAPTHLVFVTGQAPAVSQQVIDGIVAAWLGRAALLGFGQGGLALGAALGLTVPPERPIGPGLVEVCHDGCLAFGNLRYRFRAWVPRLPRLGQESLPTSLEVTATTPSGALLGFRHRTQPCEGVLFHPESSGTPDGLRWLANVFGVRA